MTARPTTESRPATDAPGLASIWRRLAARVIDLVAVATWMFAFAVAHILIHLQLWSDEITPDPWGRWFLATMTFFVLYAAYEIVFVWRTGSTPGKDLLHLKVVDAGTGGRVTLGQAVRRWLLPGAVQPIPGLWLPGLLTLLWGATAAVDRDGRGLHDRLAGTQVVPKPEPVDEDERQERRRQFRPVFIDPTKVFRAARSGDLSKLRDDDR